MCFPVADIYIHFSWFLSFENNLLLDSIFFWSNIKDMARQLEENSDVGQSFIIFFSLIFWKESCHHCEGKCTHTHTHTHLKAPIRWEKVIKTNLLTFQSVCLLTSNHLVSLGDLLRISSVVSTRNRIQLLGSPESQCYIFIER